jgi:hypothetical protein
MKEVNVKIDVTINADELYKLLLKLKTLKQITVKVEQNPIEYLETDRWIKTGWKTFDEILSDNLHKTYYCWKDSEYWYLLVDYVDAVDHYRQKVQND